MNKNQKSFVESYKTTAIWASNTDGCEPDGYNITDDSELSQEAKNSMQADCLRFLEKYGHLIESEPEPPTATDIGDDEWAMAGHDFWLTRNGHGAGFWDGGWPVNGEALTEACNWFGEVSLYVGDEGEVHEI